VTRSNFNHGRANLIHVIWGALAWCAACQKTLPIIEDEQPSTMAGNAGSGAMNGKPNMSAGAGQAPPGLKPCSAPPGTTVWEGRTHWFELSGADVVLVDLSVPHVLRKVSSDGTQNTELLSATPSQEIKRRLWADESTVWFNMSDTQATSEVRDGQLFRIPRDGGTPTPLSQLTRLVSDYLMHGIFADDESFLYFNDGDTIIRIEKMSGAWSTITVSDGSATPALMYEDEIWFGLTQAAAGVAHVPKTAMKAMPIKFTGQPCLGTFSVNAGGVFCGTTRFDGGNMTTRLHKELAEGYPLRMSRPFGSKVFLIDESATGPVVEADPVTLEHATLACGKGDAETVRATDRDVYWLEQDMPNKVDRIMRAPRR
jgi:hypothetical protein